QTLTQEGISPPESVSLLYSLLKSLFDITDKVRENKSHIRIRSVLDFLERVHKTPISLNEIQRESAMSKFHLCRLFKQSTGETIGHHLTQLRLNSAAKALADGNLNVTEACFQNGFEDLSYFIQVFKKKFGTTPKQWALTSNIKINESASTSA
ncbi:MAG: helix-turn-helix transcriptional regulator, partial [Fibrobacteres bacterium]|nr:helix-turn-helix transcriptional regulator [Fibrobacterota bacterium]